MSEFSGAGAIFGTTGGVMEAAVRTIYAVVNGKELDNIELTQLRGFEGVREATVDLGGPFGEVKVAMVHGLGDTRALVEKVRKGEVDYDFIEVMACPGGCVDGGGSLRSKKAYHPTAMARRETIYAVDRTRKVRQSHNNEQVKTLYQRLPRRAELGKGAQAPAHPLHRPSPRPAAHGQGSVGRRLDEHHDLLASPKAPPPIERRRARTRPLPPPASPPSRRTARAKFCAGMAQIPSEPILQIAQGGAPQMRAASTSPGPCFCFSVHGPEEQARESPGVVPRRHARTQVFSA